MLCTGRRVPAVDSPDTDRVATKVRRLRVGYRWGPAPVSGKAECFHRTRFEEWPTSDPGPQNNNAAKPSNTTSTTTITADPAEHSDGPHPSKPYNPNRDNLPEYHN